MRHPKFIFIFTLLILLTAGCAKSRFSISFKFPQDYQGNYILEYYAWDSKRGSWIEDVASVQNGVAEIECAAVRPTLVYVRDASNASNSIAIYAERGDKIVISGDRRDMNTWSVNGNKISQRWSRWRNENTDVLTSSRDRQSKEKEKAVADFINANKDDRLSTLILLTEWDRRENPDGFVKLWNSIDKDARKQQFIEMCGCTDLLGMEFAVDAKGNLERAKSKPVAEIMLRTRDNGLDTLRPRKVRASLLYFYAENNSERNTAVDSLRVISREYSDSTRRIIATVSLQPDSMAWISAVRLDSVKGAVHAWAPRGVADRSMADMGVTRFPWFVVLASDGKDAYAGDDVADALTAFRKEMKKKEMKKKDKASPTNTKK